MFLLLVFKKLYVSNVYFIFNRLSDQLNYENWFPFSIAQF